MSSTAKAFTASLTSLLLILAPALAPVARAQTRPTKTDRHVVSSADLAREIAASVAARRANQARIQAFLANPRARKTLKRAGVDYRVVQRAIPLLSQEELASLAVRADKAQRQFEAGSLTNQQLTYIIIALATAVIVLIAVH